MRSLRLVFVIISFLSTNYHFHFAFVTRIIFVSVSVNKNITDQQRGCVMCVWLELLAAVRAKSVECGWPTFKNTLHSMLCTNKQALSTPSADY